MKKIGFTLAEVLITLAIIGVVAALTIPSVVANTQQQEFKTGLRKAVSVLNSAITMNMAIDGETPYDNHTIYLYLIRHMSTIKTAVFAPFANVGGFGSNLSFYTTDGMRFEAPTYATAERVYLHENKDVHLRALTAWSNNGDELIPSSLNNKNNRAGNCGSYGLEKNPNNTKNAPCLIVVDVNGDRKPFPKNAACMSEDCKSTNTRKYGDPAGRKLTDTFPIMITDTAAIPYGMAAQKAMYEAQK